MTEVTLAPPRERECERCGRRDRWDDEAGHWRIERGGGGFCLHTWNVDGSYNPIETGEV